MRSDIPNRLSVATLWTGDVPATVRFYAEVLSLRLCDCGQQHMDPPHFSVGDGYLAIVKGKQVLGPDAEVFPAVALAVEGLDGTIERLHAHHIELLRGVEEDAVSRWVFVRDPGGNMIEIVHWL